MIDNNNNNIILACILLFIISINCSDNEISPRQYPRIETLEVTNISTSGVQFNAEILNQGGDDIIEYGFVWSLKVKNPKIGMSEKRIIADEISTGKFSAAVSTTLVKGSYYVRAYAKNNDYLVYGVSVRFESQGSEAASIESFYPKIGTWGDTIFLKGNNFSYLTKSNLILFNELKSTVIKSSDTTIVCIVPQGISEKSVSIYLDIAGEVTEAKDKFELISPKIESITPLLVTFNDTLKLIGKNFSTDKNKNHISFNGNQGEVVAASKTSLSVVVPTSVNTQWNTIEISVNLQTSVSKELLEIYAPIINDLEPYSQFTKSLIKVTGNYFNPDKLGDTIIFDNNFGEVVDASKKELIVKVPDGIYTNRSFNVELKVAGQKASSSNLFTLKDPWIRKVDIPYESSPRYHATGFSLFNNGYVGLGLGNYSVNSYDNDANNDFYKYDPILNAWTKLSNFGGGSRYYASSFVIGNYAYVGLGYKGSSNFLATDDFWKYDANNDSWLEIARLPVTAANAVGLASNKKGYICTSDDTNNFWEYDPDTNEWTKLPDLVTIQSGPKGIADSGFVIADKIYIYASGNSTGLHQLYEYDINTMQWTRKADMIDSGIRSGVVGFSIKAKGYIIDIYNVHEYNPINDTWIVKELIPGRSRENGIGFVIDNKAYFGSGEQQGSSASDIWEYDPKYE